MLRSQSVRRLTSEGRLLVMVTLRIEASLHCEIHLAQDVIIRVVSHYAP